MKIRLINAASLVLALATSVCPLAHAVQAHRPQLVPACQLLSLPSNAGGDLVRVRGQYVVSGEQRCLSCPDDDLFVVFEAGYRQRSDSRAIKLLDELQRRSSPYPKPGHPSLVVVPFQRADVVFRGRLEPNPEYQPSPPAGAEINDPAVDPMVQLQVGRSESAAFAYRFRVERVERARRISKSTPW